MIQYNVFECDNYAEQMTLFVEHLCFLFKSLFISDFRLINVSVNIFNIIALSSLCSCTT